MKEYSIEKRSIWGYKRVHLLSIGVLFVMLILMLCGCAADVPEVIKPEAGEKEISGLIIYDADSYDSADTPILMEKDVDNGTMTFYNLDVSKSYTLEYDGTTRFYDKYGNTLSLAQINVGDIVDVKFIKPKKHLTSMQLSADSWSIKDTNRYEINPVKHEVTIGEDTYKVSNEAKYFSPEKELTSQDIVDTDVLSFQGIGSTVYSVFVEKGHGYLRLTGHQNFVGGWIEIGNSVIQKVTEEMLLTVSEGTYQVKISNDGTISEKKVTINRNSESSIDFSDVEFLQPKEGTIIFSVTPAKAELYIDGEKTDISEPIKLTYGLHQLICRAEGYTSVTQYLNVGQASAGISVTLEKEEEKKEDKKEDKSDSEDTDKKDSDSASDATDASKNDNTSSTDKNDKTDTADESKDKNQDKDSESDSNLADGETAGGTNVVDTYYKVYIDSPEAVEVYLDGAYVGISPCSFKKKEGLHIVTLSKSGFETRSYTINVDSEEKDISFSFVELLPSGE